MAELVKETMKVKITRPGVKRNRKAVSVGTVIEVELVDGKLPSSMIGKCVDVDAISASVTGGLTQADVDAAFAKGKAEAMEEFVVNPEVQREFIVNAVEKKTGKKPRSDSKLSTMAAELEKPEQTEE